VAAAAATKAVKTADNSKAKAADEQKAATLNKQATQRKAAEAGAKGKK
jgi:hypothetical protein